MVTSNTSTSSTTGTAVQTSTATTDVTQSRTVIITSGTAACSAITDRTTEAGTFYNTFPQGNGGSYYGGFISYTVSTQVVCVDDFSNTTQFSSSSYSGKYYSTFSYGSDISTLPSGTGSEQTITYSPPLTDVSYTISSSYTVSETTTVSGTVTISG